MKNERNIASAATGVLCPIDGEYVHSIPAWIKENHGMTVEEYQKIYGSDAVLYSDKFLKARERALEQREETKAAMSGTEGATVLRHPKSSEKRPMSEVFGIDEVSLTSNARGEQIKCSVLGTRDDEWDRHVPAIDNNYIFPVDILKTVMVAGELNLPMLLWGLHGTGKSTLVEQYCARTNRPMTRVQHSIGTEEAHVLGHYVVKGGDTVFEPGPLPLAMKYGLVYLADEYDFAIPNVTALYQPVLEGKQLVIKEAPPEWRYIEPHPNFRFYATGNTNGGGDETGLYQGTQMMNAANYSRFAITIKVPYMSNELETSVVQAQAGLMEDDAIILVSIAAEVRQSFERGDLSTTVSPRELINAGRLARVFGVEPDLVKGFELAFTNRLNATDKQAVHDYIQRIIK